MSNRKPPEDWSPSYLQRQSQAWCKVHKERVRGIIKQKRLAKGMDSKLIYLGLQTYFHDGNGVLIEPIARVAKDLGFTPERIEECIQALIDDGGWLERSESGQIYDPVLFKFITGAPHPDLAESSRIAQDYARSRQILHFPPGQTSPVEKIREDGFSTTPPQGGGVVTKTGDCSTDFNTDNPQKGAPPSLTRAVPFCGLSEIDLETVRSEFPNLDFDKVYAKFVAYHTKKGSERVTRVQLAGWFKREKEAGRHEASPAVSTVDTAAAGWEKEKVRLSGKNKLTGDDVRDEDGDWIDTRYFIGKTQVSENKIDRMLHMHRMSEQQACRWLFETVGYEFDTPQALRQFKDSLFDSFEDEGVTVWQGSDYETPEQIAEFKRQQEAKAEKEAKEKAEKEVKEKAEQAEKEEKRKRKADMIRNCIEKLKAKGARFGGFGNQNQRIIERALDHSLRDDLVIDFERFEQHASSEHHNFGMEYTEFYGFVCKLKDAGVKFYEPEQEAEPVSEMI